MEYVDGKLESAHEWRRAPSFKVTIQGHEAEVL